MDTLPYTCLLGPLGLLVLLGPLVESALLERYETLLRFNPVTVMSTYLEGEHRALLAVHSKGPVQSGAYTAYK